jgi:hypothetical protein
MPHERQSHHKKWLALITFVHTAYLSEYAIVPLLLWLWYNAEHKLEQVDSILEAEGAETELISNSVLSMRVSVIKIIN